MPNSFDELISSPEKTFLKHFKPSFSSQTEDSQVEHIRQPGTMSKIPTSGSKPSTMSRLAPPGSLSKRPREGSLDLETGLDAKKPKTEKSGSNTSNLSKSKSKSMMSINGTSAPAGKKNWF